MFVRPIPVLPDSGSGLLPLGIFPLPVVDHHTPCAPPLPANEKIFC